MPTMNQLAPTAFAKLHRELFEGIVAPLAAGVSAKSLSSKLHMEAYGRKRAPDVALVFDNNSGSSITRLVNNGTLQFARDPATKSVAMLRSIEGESESWLSVLDESKQKRVGTWAVSDDGTKDWTER